MSLEGDPYRVLGVAPDATLNEVRSAYRRLVKQWHPDTAGERALPRFLAIQAAYERLVDGEGRLRPIASRPSARPGGTRPSPGPRADPSRARASRDAWRARRAGWAPGAQAPPGASHQGGQPGGGAARGGPGRTRTDDGGSRERKGHHRTTRKATPGSTTYDEAAEPLDPRWGGAGWYGASSGTYWTINPREYADPRKHGPEYLARARRASVAGDPDGSTASGPAPSDPTDEAVHAEAGETDATGGAWRWSANERTRTQGDPHDWGARAWSFASNDEDAARPARGEHRRTAAPPQPDAPRHHRRRPAPTTAPVMDLEGVVRRAFPDNLRRLVARGLGWRILVVLLAWPPLGYAAAAIADVMTGCGAFSAECAEPLDLASAAVQVPLLLALFLVPSVAASAAFASLAALAAAFPAALAASLAIPLSPDLARVVLSALVVSAWTVAFAGPELLRRRATSHRPRSGGPVP